MILNATAELDPRYRFRPHVVDQNDRARDRRREYQRHGERDLLEAHRARQERQGVADEPGNQVCDERREGVVSRVHVAETLADVAEVETVTDAEVDETADDDDGDFQRCRDERNFPTAAEFRVDEDDLGRVDLVRFDVIVELFLRRFVVVESEKFDLARVQLKFLQLRTPCDR